MSRAQPRAASRKDAKSSRRAEVRAREAARERSGQSWDRPLRRSRRAIESALRLIDSSSRVIEAAARSAAGRPIYATAKATQRLLRVYGWVATAAGLLERSCRGMHDTTERVALAPERAANAPQLFVETAMRWADATVRLAEISDWLDAVFALLLDSAKRGIVLTDPSELTVGTTIAAAAARPTAARLFLAERPSRNTGRFSLVSIRRSIRRPRSAPATAVEGARRISRGRAPPLASTCQL